MDSHDRQGRGKIILPFCPVVVARLFGTIGILQQYFQIRFITKRDNPLCEATGLVNVSVMQNIFGKVRHQEDLYCKMVPHDLKQHSIDGIVMKDLVKLLHRIPNYEQIRFIELCPLLQHHPSFNDFKMDKETGGFIELTELNPKNKEDEEFGIESGLLELETSLKLFSNLFSI